MQVRKVKYQIITAIAILLAATSCQKVIDLKLDSAATQIVIEANFNNVRGTQSVVISQSVPFTNTNTFPPVSGANVTISDNKGTIYKLVEGVTPGTYSIANIAGRPGTTYTLTVVANGKTYTANSTMPAPVFYSPVTYSADTFKPNSQLMTIHFQDAPNIPNQYRFIEYVNGTEVKVIFVSDDTFSDGGSVDINLYQNDLPIKTGDLVILEEQGIDRNMFNYWFSLSQQQNGGAGAGTTPSNPPSNISNDALGYFSAHTTTIQNLTIQ